MVESVEGWPRAEDLTKKLFTSRRNLDVMTVAANMPPSMGRLEQGRVVLTVRGASYHGAAKAALRLYVRAVRLAVDRFPEADGEALIATQDLTAIGAENENDLRTFYRIVEGERWALSSAGGSQDQLSYRLNTPAAIALKPVKTLSKYLEAQANAWWPESGADGSVRAPLLAMPPTATPMPSDESERHVADGSLGWLHPAIREASAQLVELGHFREAVERGVVVLQDEIRRLARSDSDGEPLMNAAFAPKNPRVVVANRRTDSGRSIQRGTHLLSQGLIAAIRNPTSHRLVEYTRAEALERLAIMSFIYRRLDETRLRRERARLGVRANRRPGGDGARAR
jgi:uncharacterized protein (TIGR02391 family)